MSSKARCPKCSFTFEVDKKQLKIAGGVVRCPDCNDVFDANDNWVIDDDHDDGMDTKELDALLDESEEEELHDGNVDPALKFRFEDYPIEDDDEEIVVDPSSTMRHSFKEGADSLVDYANEKSDDGMVFSDAFLSTGSDESFDDNVEDDHDKGSDESWADALLEEEEEEERQIQAEAKDLNKATVDNTGKADAGLLLSKAAISKVEQSHKEKSKTDSTNDASDNNIFKNKDTHTAGNIKKPAPVKPADAPKLEVRRVKTTKGPSVAAYLFFSVLLLLLLAGQVLWFNHDRLVHAPDTRPIYQSICNVVGCTLPTQQDFTKIKHSNLIVRQHPDYKNTLLIETLLNNKAPFPQAYPKIEITFTDELGNIISRRTLTANQYLYQDADKKLMPPKQNVHLAFAIKDPGDKALRSMLKLLPSS